MRAKLPCLDSDNHAANHQRKTCLKCKAVYNRKHRRLPKWEQYYKERNARIYGTSQDFAKRWVYTEVRSGRIPKAALLMCKDCGKQASVYDHRDYNKPYIIDPVCRSCNARRGPAIP